MWEVPIERSGRSALWLDFACADATAGHVCVLHAEEVTLTAPVPGTGASDNYREKKFG